MIGVTAVGAGARDLLVGGFRGFDTGINLKGRGGVTHGFGFEPLALKATVISVKREPSLGGAFSMGLAINGGDGFWVSAHIAWAMVFAVDAEFHGLENFGGGFFAGDGFVAGLRIFMRHPDGACFREGLVEAIHYFPVGHEFEPLPAKTAGVAEGEPAGEQEDGWLPFGPGGVEPERLPEQAEREPDDGAFAGQEED